MKEFDLKSLNLPPGDYIVTIVAKADGYRNSRPSIVINYGNPGEWTAGLKFVLINENEYEVCGYEGTAKNVDVPSIYKGKPVTSIGFAAFRHCTSVTTINLPDSIRYIKDDAFNGCASLRELELGKGISSIGNWAFLNCSSIQKLDVLKDVAKIGTDAFRGWNSSQIIHFDSEKDISNNWNYYWKSGCDASVLWKDNYFISSIYIPLTSSTNINGIDGNGENANAQLKSAFLTKVINGMDGGKSVYSQLKSSFSTDIYGIDVDGKDIYSQLKSSFSTNIYGIDGGKSIYSQLKSALSTDIYGIDVDGKDASSQLKSTFSTNVYGIDGGEIVYSQLKSTLSTDTNGIDGDGESVNSQLKSTLSTRFNAYEKIDRHGEIIYSQLKSIFNDSFNSVVSMAKEGFLSEYSHLVSELAASKGIAKIGELQQNFSLNSIIDIKSSPLGISTKVINPIETALNINSSVQEDIDYLHTSIDNKCLQTADAFVTTLFENIQASIENEFFIHSFLQTNEEGRIIETGDALKASSKLDVTVAIRRIKLLDLKGSLSDYANLKLS